MAGEHTRHDERESDLVERGVWAECRRALSRGKIRSGIYLCRDGVKRRGRVDGVAGVGGGDGGWVTTSGGEVELQQLGHPFPTSASQPGAPALAPVLVARGTRLLELA